MDFGLTAEHPGPTPSNDFLGSDWEITVLTEHLSGPELDAATSQLYRLQMDLSNPGLGGLWTIQHRANRSSLIDTWLLKSDRAIMCRIPPPGGLGEGERGASAPHPQ